MTRILGWIGGPARFIASPRGALEECDADVVMGLTKIHQGGQKYYIELSLEEKGYWLDALLRRCAGL